MKRTKYVTIRAVRKISQNRIRNLDIENKDIEISTTTYKLQRYADQIRISGLYVKQWMYGLE